MIALDGVTILTPAGTPILVAAHLHVDAGEVYALVGDRTPVPILVDTLLGFSKPQAGSIAVSGHSPATHPTEVRRLVTAIRTPSGLEPRLTVRANIRLLMCLDGRMAPRNDAIDAALRESDLPDRRFDRPAAELTPFEERIVSLAVARLRATPILLCENPTAGLAERDAAGLAILVRELAATGRAVLITTDDAQFARAVADRGAVLEHGTPVLDWMRSELPPVPAVYLPGPGHGQ
ncbi:MAG TPA: ATP-binding cassette domain-containing protein [Vicinamibacterales bacterium]|nr:ATP-binding cassette domain-containing protein [Vicinamibacterales bacterium]